MQINTFIKPVIYLLILLAGGCVDPYRPPEIAAPDSYLVVNGYFNSTPGTTTTIQLARTQNLSDKKVPVAETRAQVSIETKGKATYTLREGTGGTYTLTGVSPQIGDLYRLHIKTTKGGDYFSEYVPVIPTPPVDSVSWRIEDNGVQINVNTHDPKNIARYYRWDFESSWEYTVPYFSTLEVKGNQIVDRQPSVYRCWGSENSVNIMTFSTTRLSQAVVSQFPLTYIPGTSLKLGVKYSILVKQIALSQSGFDYYDQLGKITQNVGSIFDPQPSQITGNIQSPTNPNDLVIGFFRVGTVETKRLFIRSSQLPNWPNLLSASNCVIDTLTQADVLKAQPTILSYDFELRKYFTTSPDCADCRTKGGVIQRPVFWE